ncbi:hypothetical protein BZA77DRAFT_330976 [Pyronema omphalodes]|nr:hypothetical protein BZA77DRAFT_330976 [Pyronema omphalodes]
MKFEASGWSVLLIFGLATLQLSNAVLVRRVGVETKTIVVHEITTTVNPTLTVISTYTLPSPQQQTTDGSSNNNPSMRRAEAPATTPTTLIISTPIPSPTPTPTDTSKSCPLSYHSCPGGGCCAFNFQCGPNGSCLVPASITQTRTCHPPLSTCPGSVGGGCCPPGFACGNKDCVSLIPNQNDTDGTNNISVAGSRTISVSHTKIAKVTDVDIAAQFTPGVTDTPKAVTKKDSKKIALIGAVCGGVAAVLLKRGNTDVPQGVMTGHGFSKDGQEGQQPRWAFLGGWKGSDMQRQQQQQMGIRQQQQQEPVFDTQTGHYVMRESQQNIPEQQIWPLTLPPGGFQQMRRVKTFPPRRSPQRYEIPQKVLHPREIPQIPQIPKIPQNQQEPISQAIEILKKQPMEIISELPYDEPDYDSTSQSASHSASHSISQSTTPMLSYHSESPPMIIEPQQQTEIPKRTLSSPEDGGKGRLWMRNI